MNLSHESDYRTLKEPSKKKCFFTSEKKEAFLADFLSKTSCPGNIKVEIPNMDRLITIYGGNLIDRETKSHGSKNLVVLSSFEDLCKGYKSVNDYRALMEKTALLYLDGIESIPENELNFARRFIQLIDVAYEHKTRVVLRGNKECLNIHDILKLVATGKDEKSVSEVLESQIIGKGGSSSSSATTYIGDMEWSATGLLKASMARGGNADTRFAVNRTVSRLAEMHSADWDSEYD
jgi:predicted ATPase